MTIKRTIKRGFILNILHQLLLIIVPIILTPYISRVLKPDGVGINSFTTSLISYFTIFAALGFTFYAQREISRSQGDIAKQSKTFWEILICRSASVGIAIVLNVILCLTHVYGVYEMYMILQTINIVVILIDITFFFQGQEKFGRIVSFNSLARVASVILIYTLVKTENDLWIYILINSVTALAANALLWIYIPKSIVKVPFKELKPFRHLKGTLLLFLPTVAVSIYTILDRTLIGAMIPGEVVVEGVTKKISELENGYYEQSEKIVKMLLVLFTAIASVMIPRNSKEFASGNIEQVKKNIYLSSNLVWLLGIPIILGLFLVIPCFVPIFFGPGYDKCVVLILTFSSLVLFIGFSNVLGVQYLVPTQQDRRYTIALVSGAFINLILNLFFIKYWWSTGAAIASIIAEFSVTLIMFWFVRKELDIKKIFKLSIKYIIAGAVMFTPLFFLDRFCLAYFLAGKIWEVIIIAGLGIIIYFSTLLILKDRLTMQVTKRIINWFRRKEGKKELDVDREI